MTDMSYYILAELIKLTRKIKQYYHAKVEQKTGCI